MEPYMGRYFSAYYVRNKILKQTETEIKEMDKQIEKEIADGIFLIQINLLILQPECQWIQIWTLENQSMEPDLESQGSATEAPEGGEI